MWIEAFIHRGHNDFRASHDMEDIITVLDGQRSFDLLFESPTDSERIFTIKI